MELRIAGLLLLSSGWILMLASITLLKSLPARTVFVVGSLAVEALGFSLLARSYIPKRRKRDA